MSRRPDPCRKKPLDVLDDLLAGHREAAYGGPAPAAKYLERALVANKSMPNACKFFLFDLLAEATADADPARCREAIAQARHYLSEAQAEAPRHWQEYRLQMRAFERGIALAVEAGEYAEALALCEEALTLGLGKHYEAKANSIRRLL